MISKEMAAKMATENVEAAAAEHAKLLPQVQSALNDCRLLVSSGLQMSPAKRSPFQAALEKRLQEMIDRNGSILDSVARQAGVEEREQRLHQREEDFRRNVEAHQQRYSTLKMALTYREMSSQTEMHKHELALQANTQAREEGSRQQTEVFQRRSSGLNAAIMRRETSLMAQVHSDKLAQQADLNRRKSILDRREALLDEEAKRVAQDKKEATDKVFELNAIETAFGQREAQVRAQLEAWEDAIEGQEARVEEVQAILATAEARAAENRELYHKLRTIVNAASDAFVEEQAALDEERSRVRCLRSETEQMLAHVQRLHVAVKDEKAGLYRMQQQQALAHLTKVPELLEAFESQTTLIKSLEQVPTSVLVLKSRTEKLDKLSSLSEQVGALGNVPSDLQRFPGMP